MADTDNRPALDVVREALEASKQWRQYMGICGPMRWCYCGDLGGSNFCTDGPRCIQTRAALVALTQIYTLDAQ